MNGWPCTDTCVDEEVNKYGRKESLKSLVGSLIPVSMANSETKLNNATSFQFSTPSLEFTSWAQRRLELFNDKVKSYFSSLSDTALPFDERIVMSD